VAYNDRGFAKAYLKDFAGAKADFEKAKNLFETQKNKGPDYQLALDNIQFLNTMQKPKTK
jgi:hypothetical protein